MESSNASLNTTGKPPLYTPSLDNNSGAPSWKKSAAVKSFLLAIEIPWYYDLPDISGDAARTTGSSVVLGVHQLSVMITTFIALAIPLTANFYTPRLVDIFLKDTTNIFFLVVFAILSSVSVFMNSFLWSFTSAPILPYCIMVVSAILGWIVIIPYYYYVMKFLDPEVIVDRVARILIKEIRATVKGKREPSESRKELNTCILQIGDIAFRSLDRKDSRTAISCIQALCFALDIFREQKHLIDKRFFQVEVSEFPMLSKSGLSWLSHSSLWVEEQILRQIQKSFAAALDRGMPGIVSFISLSLREQCIPLMNNDAHDRANLELFIRFINTFLREAINQRNIRALFNMFYQYASLAKDLSKWCPDLLLSTVKYISNYGKLCSNKNLEIAVQTNYYDLGNLCGYIFRVNSPHAAAILDIYLDNDYTENISVLEKRGIVHSRMILGSFLMYIADLLNRDLSWAIDQVKQSLLRVPIKNIHAACQVIVETVDEMFWEITDRIVNFDYVPPQQRFYVIKLRDDIITLHENNDNSDISEVVGSFTSVW